MTALAPDAPVTMDKPIDLAARPRVPVEQQQRAWYDTRPRGGKPRVLFVDDEPHVLEAVSRVLHDAAEVVTAIGGRAGIATLQAQGPFDVIVTDMRMPEVDGVAVLKAARDTAPDTTRILLTGQTDLQAAIAAVNDGSIFRFLLKPCPPSQMRQALQAAVDQHRLVSTEKELLQDTLKGALKLCMDVLSLVHPHALARAARVRRIAGSLASKAAPAELWSIEVAALLAYVGAITLPPGVLEKLHMGATLTLGEQRMAERLPVLGAQLVSDIPRLEPVRDILRFQRTWYDGTHSPERGVAGEALPIGARILLIADDYDVLEARNMSLPARLRVLESRRGVYDPALLATLRELLTSQGEAQRADDGTVLRVELVQLGMVFAEDVVGQNGLVLIGRGQEVTVALLERINLLPLSVRHRLVKVQPAPTRTR